MKKKISSGGGCGYSWSMVVYLTCETAALIQAQVRHFLLLKVAIAHS